MVALVNAEKGLSAFKGKKNPNEFSLSPQVIFSSRSTLTTAKCWQERKSHVFKSLVLKELNNPSWTESKNTHSVKSHDKKLAGL